ncbi:MAG: VCBS repeat-containing protein, partial [Thermoplasmata archaeon]|nr:VCBS repeat-containing protein [Thermoplasmata archaeon]
HLDIVAFGYLANGIQLYLGDGTGQFSSNKGIINNNWYITIAIGDFNGDSYPDIAADKWIVPMGIDVWFQLPKDPVTLIENLINDIEDMDLPKGIENSLVSKLENALKSLEKENYGAAINQMNAFINEVEAQSGKKIPEDEAVELEDDGHFVNEAILEKS